MRLSFALITTLATGIFISSPVMAVTLNDDIAIDTNNGNKYFTSANSNLSEYTAFNQNLISDCNGYVYYGGFFTDPTGIYFRGNEQTQSHVIGVDTAITWQPTTWESSIDGINWNSIPNITGIEVNSVSLYANCNTPAWDNRETLNLGAAPNPPYILWKQTLPVPNTLPVSYATSSMILHNLVGVFYNLLSSNILPMIFIGGLLVTFILYIVKKLEKY